MDRVLASRRSRRRWHWLLLIVPFAWCTGFIPLVNQTAYAFGSVPFLLVWMAAGPVVGSACLGTVYLIDRRNGDLDRV